MPTNSTGLALFETERLIGREWRESDLDAAYAIYSDPEVMLGLNHPPEPDRESQLINMMLAVKRYREMERGMGFWALERKSDARVVGASIVKAIPEGDGKVEVGWQLAREFWGQGYATEAAKEAIRIAFENLPIAKIHCLVMPWNERSLKVAERLRFVRGEPTLKYYGCELIEHWRERVHGAPIRTCP